MRRPLACFLTARSHPVGRGEDTQRGGTAPPLPPDLTSPRRSTEERRQGTWGPALAPALQGSQGWGMWPHQGPHPAGPGPSLRAEGTREQERTLPSCPWAHTPPPPVSGSPAFGQRVLSLKTKGKIPK